MKVFIMLCLCLLNISAFAQKENISNSSVLKLYSQIQFGLLEGESKSAFEAQAINGLRCKTWRAGIGVGIDNYKFRSIPFFFNLSKDILKKTTTPFVYADLGIHFSWVRDDQKIYYYDADYSNGLYYNIGAGYKISLFRNNFLIFSAAYSFKQMSNTYKNIYFCVIDPCLESQNSIDLYKLRRLSLQVGWMF